MHVTVLFGGPSDERKISLVSGQAVIDGLRSMGHEVFASDISPADLSGLDHPADVIFPVLHGQFGESGELQEILEARGLHFVGSGSAASQLGMDKVEAKRAWERAGLPTPPYAVLSTEIRQTALLDEPCVVKAISSGSSIDVYVCKDPQTCGVESRKALDTLLSKQPQVLVEKFIDGMELTVGLLEEKPLAPIRIVPKRAFFNYDAKYSDGGAEHRFDLGLSDSAVEQVRELAAKANAVIGARDLARIDIMLDSHQRPYLLEINTLPGFTPVSLLPEAARHAGIEFGALVDRLVVRARNRRAS